MRAAARSVAQVFMAFASSTLPNILGDRVHIRMRWSPTEFYLRLELVLFMFMLLLGIALLIAALSYCAEWFIFLFSLSWIMLRLCCFLQMHAQMSVCVSFSPMLETTCFALRELPACKEQIDRNLRWLGASSKVYMYCQRDSRCVEVPSLSRAPLLGHRKIMSRSGVCRTSADIRQCRIFSCTPHRGFSCVDARPV